MVLSLDGLNSLRMLIDVIEFCLSKLAHPVNDQECFSSQIPYIDGFENPIQLSCTQYYLLFY